MLRSESCSLLTSPKTTQLSTERNLSGHQPTVWNNMPNHIKFAANKEIFCTKVLKTHLFKLSYL